jgi:hypothetical protein
MTAKQIVESALRIVGVLASGEEGQPAELQDGLAALNGLIGSWNNNSLIIPSMTERTFALSNKQEYTYGPGGDFDAVRPMSIQYAQFKDVTGKRYTCENYGTRQWAELNYPTTMRSPGFYFEQSYPLAKVKFPYLPYLTDVIVFQTLEPLSKVSSITQEINLPDGYDRALKLNLAVELAAEYQGVLKPETVQLALLAKKDLEVKNTRVESLTFDFTTATGFYNIIQGPMK